MNRHQLVLAGLLAVQIVLILLLRAPFAAGSPTTETRPLVPALEAFTPTRIELVGADDKERLNLRQRDGAWTVEEAGGFPADAQKVDDLLEDLRGIRVRRPVISSRRYHEAFKVEEDDFEARVRIWGEAADKPQVDLIFGDSPNYRISHVRLAGDDKVYEARDIAPYDLRAAATAWTVKELVEVPEEQVVELALTNSNGSLRLAREDGSWKIEEPAALRGRALDVDKVAALVRSASSLRMDEPAGRLDEAAQGLAEPAAVLRLRWRKGPAVEAPASAGAGEAAVETEEVVVRVGGKLPERDTQRYITRSGFAFTGTIWDSSISKLLEQQASDLLRPS